MGPEALVSKRGKYHAQDRGYKKNRRRGRKRKEGSPKLKGRERTNMNLTFARTLRGPEKCETRGGADKNFA